MSNLFDYLTWRGDLSLSRVPFGSVDNLILSALVYVHLDSVVSSQGAFLPLKDAAEIYFALPEEQRGRTRCPQDLELLQVLAQSPRFSGVKLGWYADRFEPENEMQFAAMTILLDENTAFLAFRGTDATLVGWKEDFNMSFMDTVPAQTAALHYTAAVAAQFPGDLILGGHSKGGNLAVYAATQSPPELRSRIISVYSNDGPGFTDAVLNTNGYRELLPRIHTYLPQSSIVGMLLEHEEPYTVVKSSQVGPLQHDPYSWDVLGGDFVQMEEVTAGSRLADRAIKQWLACFTPEEREEFVDGVFALLPAGEASYTSDLKRPANIQAAIRAWQRTSGDSRHVLTHTFAQLFASAAGALKEELRQNSSEPGR